MKLGAMGYRWRALSPSEETEVRRCARGGARPSDLAELYNVSTGTIYRTLRREALPTTTVRVGPYEAPFIVGEDGPVQRGPWVASRARAWDNDADEYSVAIAHNAQRPGPRLYSESRGVDVPEYRRNG